MQLLSKNIVYTCIKAGDKLKINGAINLDSSTNLINFSGNFNTLEDKYCGDFVYQEVDKEKSNIAINNISLNIITDAYDFLVNVIKEIKLKLTSVN